MKKIKLTQGHYALVDDEDFEELNKFSWCSHKNGNNFYAGRQTTIDNGEYYLKMHRLIMGLKKGDNKQIDHINGNGLDNRKSNLRICTGQQNQFNQKPQKISSSKYKGVSWHGASQKWQARININHKKIHLGVFDNEIDAAKAYNEKAKELYGEFARLNEAREA